MDKVWKKLISAFLALVMVFQLFPASALATEQEEPLDEDINWDMPEPEEPDVVGEVEELRDYTSKQFRLSDGSFAAVDYGVPVHYLDEEETWADVDNTLTFSASAGQFLSENGNEQRGFAGTLTSGQPVLTSRYADYAVELTLLPMAIETVDEEVPGTEEHDPDSGNTNAPETEPEPMEATDPNPVTEDTAPTEATSAPEVIENTEATEAPETTAAAEASEATEAMETVSETTETEETEAETTVPEETIPETSVPETTLPEETTPETTAPTETVPETTIPPETVPETTEPEKAEDPIMEGVAPSNVSAVVVNPGDTSLYSPREDIPLSEEVLPKKLGSHVIYEGVFPGIDLMYENFGYNIKETILVNEHQNAYSYRFLLAAEGMTPTLEEDGSINMADADGTVIYSIPVPYMYDAAGEISYAVEYTLEKAGDDYLLTVTANKDWIEDAQRVLPVAIDPTITVVRVVFVDDLTTLVGALPAVHADVLVCPAVLQNHLRVHLRQFFQNRMRR